MREKGVIRCKSKYLSAFLVIVMLIGMMTFSSGTAEAWDASVDRNVGISEKSLDEELASEGDWHYKYDAPHRSDADNALDFMEVDWLGAIRVELPAGEVTDIAYYNWDQFDNVAGGIYTDGGNEPGALIGETGDYVPTVSHEWIELPLSESVTIDGGYYWIGLAIHNPDADVYPFGVMESYVEDGGWVSRDEGDTWDTLDDLGWDYSWALETSVIEQTEPAEFALQGWSINPDPVDAGETFSVEGDIENVGKETGDETVELYMNGNSVDSETINNLAPSDSQTVTFQHSEEEIGNYDVQVETNDDQWTNEIEVEPGGPNFVEVNPVDDLTITAGNEENFSAEVYDEYDNLITDDDTDFTWENTDSSGLFDETEAGGYEVQATYEGVTSDPTAVTVEPAEVDYVIIDPSDDQTIDSGETIDFSAEAYDEYNNLITADDTDFTWENADSSGTFDEDDAGDFEVSAEYEGETSDSTTVTVETFWSNYWWLIALIVIGAVIAIGLIMWKKKKSSTEQQPYQQQSPPQQPQQRSEGRSPPSTQQDTQQPQQQSQQRSQQQTSNTPTQQESQQPEK